MWVGVRNVNTCLVGGRVTVYDRWMINFLTLICNVHVYSLPGNHTHKVLGLLGRSSVETLFHQIHLPNN